MGLTMQFFPGNSLFHRMDPLSKGFWIIILSVFAFVLSAPQLLGTILMSVLVLIFAAAKVPFRRFIKPFMLLALLGLCAGFFQVFARNGAGPAAINLGNFHLTTSALMFGATFAIRIMLIATASLLFIWTTDPRDFIVSLIYLRVPYRIAYAMFVALRFVPLLEHEMQIIREAQTVRGVEEVKGKLEALKRYVVPLLVTSIRRSESMGIAMESRAFGAFPNRTFIKNFAWTASGIVLLLVYAAFGGALTYLGAQMGGLLQR